MQQKNKDLEIETVQSQIKRDKQGLIWKNMGQTEGVGAIQVLCKPFLAHS